LLRIDQSADLNLAWRIEAPRIRVWDCITDADLLRQWLGDLVSGSVKAESSFVVNHGDDYCCRSTVTAWDEPCRLDFTWHFPDEPASKVALELEESGGTTDLRLSHSARQPHRVIPGWVVRSPELPRSGGARHAAAALDVLAAARDCSATQHTLKRC
jgi:uncharacterized protein YndB with AHSA1/START domain